jgi:hypothetical protein
MSQIDGLVEVYRRGEMSIEDFAQKVGLKKEQAILLLQQRKTVNQVSDAVSLQTED